MIVNEELAFRIVAVALLLVIGVGLLWPRSPAQRIRRAERWARRNWVTMSPQLLERIDLAIGRRDRAAGCSFLAGGSAAAAVSLAMPGDSTSALCGIVAASALIATLAASGRLPRPTIVASRSGSARSRTTKLSDYVPGATRLGAWVSGAICLVWIPLLPMIMPISARLFAQAGLGVVFLSVLFIAEWRGRAAAWFAGSAGDDAELYAHDAWRSELEQRTFANLILWGGFATALVGFGDNTNPGLGHLFGLAAMGLLVVAAGSQLLAAIPVDRARARLWPQLRPGEFVGRRRGRVTP